MKAILRGTPPSVMIDGVQQDEGDLLIDGVPCGADGRPVEYIRRNGVVYVLSSHYPLRVDRLTVYQAIRLHTVN